MVYFWAFLMLVTWVASVAVLRNPMRLRPLFKTKTPDRYDAGWFVALTAVPSTVVWFVAYVNTLPLPPAPPAAAPQEQVVTPKAAPTPPAAQPPRPEKTRLSAGDHVRFPKGLLTCDDPDVFVAFSQAAFRNDEEAAWAAAASPYGSRCNVLSATDTFKIKQVHYTEKKMPDAASISVVPLNVDDDWPEVYGLVLDRTFWRIVD